jgi:hypothetical protein
MFIFYIKDDGQSPKDNSQCYIPSSEPFSIHYFYRVPVLKGNLSETGKHFVDITLQITENTVFQDERPLIYSR